MTRIKHFLSGLIAAGVLIATLASASSPLRAAPNGQESGAVRPPDEIIVKYKSSNRFAEHGHVLRRMGRHAEVVRHDAEKFQAAGADKWAALREKIKKIKKDTNVLYAEPNYLGRFDETVPSAPNDPSYASQWWLPAVGDRTLWALGRGEGVIVAVIDTGVDLTHPDLSANLLTTGYNFGDDNATPQDTLGHGTKVAGIIAAGRNNAIGVSGLAPEARILPIKINPGGQGTFTSDRLADAIDYAVSHGAKIINLSLTVDNQTQMVTDAIQAALDRGVVVIAAAGNEGAAVAFPANMPGVVGVAATDQSGKLASFSNAGPEIFVAAPGANIYSTALGGGYGSANGTSFSTPIISAAIAAMVSINPALPVSQLPRHLRDNASVISGGSYPYGILNAGASANSLVPHLQLSKQQFSALDSATVNISLPPTGGAVDVYIAIRAPEPFGDFSLRADGTWARVTDGRYLPIALGYRGQEAASAVLFGSGGFFPPIALAALPVGSYSWCTALVGTATGRVIGDVMVSEMQLR